MRKIYVVIIILLILSVRSISAQSVTGSIVGIVESQPKDKTFVSEIVIEGWAVDAKAGDRQGTGVAVIQAVQGHDCDGVVLAEAETQIERPDVIAAMGLDVSYLQNGFQFTVSTENIPFHRLTISICAVSAVDGSVERLASQQYSTPFTNRNPLRFLVIAISISTPFLLFIYAAERFLKRSNDTPFGKRIYIISLLTSSLPLIYIVYIITQYGVNIPFGDDWLILVRYTLNFWDEKGFTTDFFRDSWQLINGHRLTIPIVVGTLYTDLTNLDMLAYMAMNIGIGVVIVVWMTSIFREISESEVGYLSMIPLSWLFFSPANDMWVDPRYFAYLLSVFGIVGMVWAIVVLRVNFASFSIAIVIALIGSISSFSGNFTWILAYPLLFMYGYRKKWHYTLWTLVTIAMLGAFFLDFSDALGRGSSGTLSLFDIVRGLLLFIGLSIISEVGPAKVRTPSIYLPGFLGIVLLIVIVIINWLHFRKQLQRACPYLLFICWSGLNAIAAIFGRLPNNEVWEIAPARYEIYGLIFWIGILCLTADIFVQSIRHENKSTLMTGIRYVSIAVISFIIGMSILAFSITSISYSLYFSQQEAVWCLLNEIGDRSCWERIAPNTRATEVLANTFRLKQYQTSQFTVDEYTLRPEFMDVDNDFIQPTMIDVIEKNGHLMDVLVSEEPTEFRWEIFVNDRFPATFATALVSTSDIPETVQYRLDITPKSNTIATINLDETIEVIDAIPIIIDLTPYVGMTIDIVLQHDGSSNIYWQLPRIRYDMQE